MWKWEKFYTDAPFVFYEGKCTPSNPCGHRIWQNGKYRHAAKLAENNNPTNIIGRELGGGWTEADEDTWWRHVFPSSCGKIALVGVAHFLQVHCEVKEPCILVVEACSISGSAMMESGELPGVTVHTVSIDHKNSLLTPDGVKKPTYCMEVATVCFEHVIEEAEKTHQCEYHAVLLQITSSCKSWSQASKYVHEAGEPRAVMRGCARPGPAGRHRRRDKRVHKMVTDEVDRNYDRSWSWLYGGQEDP